MDQNVKDAFDRFRSNLALTPPELLGMRIDELEGEIQSYVQLSPQERYDNAWTQYLEEKDVIRADGDVTCFVCHRRYRFHLQPLPELNPTIRILCDGTAVKL